MAHDITKDVIGCKEFEVQKINSSGEPAEFLGSISLNNHIINKGWVDTAIGSDHPHQDVKTTASPSFDNITITSPTATDVKIRDFPHGDFGGLTFEPQANGIQCWINMMNKLGDGNTRLQFRMYLLGTADNITNSEYFRLFWNISPKRFDIQSSATGTGTLRPIHLITGTNTNQLVLNTNGSLTFGTGAVTISAGDLLLARDLIFTVSGGGLSHGSMFNHNNSTTVTIGTIGAFATIPSGFSVGELNNVTFENAREFLVVQDGKYKIDWSISFNTAGGSNQDIEGGIGVDVAPQDEGTAHRFIGTASDVGNIAGTAIIRLNDEEPVHLMMRNNTDTQNIVVTHASMSIVQVGA